MGMLSRMGEIVMQLSDPKPTYRSECLRCGENDPNIWIGNGYSACGNASHAITRSRRVLRFRSIDLPAQATLISRNRH